MMVKLVREPFYDVFLTPAFDTEPEKYHTTASIPALDDAVALDDVGRLR